MSRTSKVRIVLYGVGAMSSLIARELLEREGVEIVGAIDTAKEKVGRDLGEVINVGEPLAGSRQRAYGTKEGEAVIKLDFKAYIGAKEEYDSIMIDGVPEIQEKILPVYTAIWRQ